MAALSTRNLRDRCRVSSFASDKLMGSASRPVSRQSRTSIGKSVSL